MATTVDPIALGAYFVDGDDVLIRQMGRVMQAWDYDHAEPDPDGEQVPAATVSGRLVFGGPPAPDVGDDITTWYVHIPVDVISAGELEEMRLARAADEAARPVYGLGERGEIVVAPDGSTVLRAEDMRDSRPLAFARTVLDGIHSTPIEPADDPSLGYRAARGVAQGDEPAEDIIRRLRDGVDAPSAQLSMRRRTLATFCRDYSEAFEQGDEDMLPILEGTLQLVLRRVVEVTDP